MVCLLGSPMPMMIHLSKSPKTSSPLFFTIPHVPIQVKHWNHNPSASSITCSIHRRLSSCFSSGRMQYFEHSSPQMYTKLNFQDYVPSCILFLSKVGRHCWSDLLKASSWIFGKQPTPCPTETNIYYT